MEAIARVAAERNAPLVRVGPEGQRLRLHYIVGAATRGADLQRARRRRYADLELSLLGEHQIENATVAVALAETLRDAGLPIDEAAMRAGCAMCAGRGGSRSSGARRGRRR